MQIIILLFMLSFFASPHEASAAGFDCNKATTKIEKTICKDPYLSEADERLSVLYKLALNKTKDKESLVQSQKKWLKRRNAENFSEYLLKSYKDRILELDDPIIIPISSIQSSGEGFLKRNDIERVDISDCRVSESGIIGGIDNRTFHFALYCIIPDFASEEGNCNTTSRNAVHYGKRGLSVFVQDGTSKELKLILDRGSFDIGLYTYHKPEIVPNAFGKFLYIPIELDGTGHGNESDYYIWDNELRGWKPLNSTRWLEDLSKYLPPGTFVGSGVWPNILSMTAEIYLSRKNDPNCCPSGGIALVKLKVKDDRFQIDSVKINKN